MLQYIEMSINPKYKNESVKLEITTNCSALYNVKGNKNTLISYYQCYNILKCPSTQNIKMNQ